MQQIEQVIIDYLQSYDMNKGKLAYLRVEIDKLERAIQREQNLMIDDQIMAPSQNETKAQGVVSSQVENLAIRLADGWLPQSYRDMMLDLCNLKDQYDVIRHRIDCVEAWMDGLNEQEKWIIQHQIIKAEAWKKICEKFRSEFQASNVSKDRLKRIKDRAISKIVCIVSR